MIDYERAIAKKKRKLFQDLFGLLPKSGPVVARLGMVVNSKKGCPVRFSLKPIPGIIGSEEYHLEWVNLK